MTKSPPDEMRASLVLRCTGVAHLARGEYENIQLTVVPLSGPLRQVRVVASPLEHENSSGGRSDTRLPAPDIMAIGWVRCRGQTWPDPLLPTSQLATVEGPVQAFLLRVHAPRYAPPGWYSGMVQVQAAGLPTARLPLRVRVYSFSMGPRFALRAVLGCGSPRWAHAELVRHHLNPGGMCCASPADATYALTPDGRLEVDFSRYDKVMGPLIQAGMNAFGLPFMAGDGGGLKPNRMTKIALDRQGRKTAVSLNPLDGPRAEQQLARWLRAFHKHLMSRGGLKLAFTYLWDEPSPSHFASLRRIAEVLQRLAPDIPILVTATPNGELMDVCDIVCPTVQWAATISAPDARALGDLRNAGKQLWWYNCGDPYPLPSFAIPHPLGAVRLMFWLNYKLGLRGNLYWAATFWPKGRKPYEDPGGGGYGDGMLLYPPDPRYPGRVVGSLRLEAVRDGIEDYEALTMLQQAISGQAPLLDLPPTIARNPSAYTEDPTTLEDYRVRVYRALEQKARAE